MNSIGIRNRGAEPRFPRLAARLRRCGCALLCGLLGAAAVAAPLTVRYFGQLAYNHVSPQVPIRGVHEMTAAAAAAGLPHYELRYDAGGRLMELIRKHPESWKQHPLAHVGKVYRIAFSYPAGHEERLFFDESGAPMRNIRGVFREEYDTAPDGFRSALRFYDEAGKPMNSNWHIARYAWERRAGFVVERRFDTAEQPQPMSPYFPFFTVGIRYGDDGVPTGTYNLDDATLAVTDSRQGIASYRDVYDEEGDHLSWAYFNAANRPALAWKYTQAIKTYDARGNVIRVDYVGLDGQTVQSERFAYD